MLPPKRPPAFPSQRVERSDAKPSPAVHRNGSGAGVVFVGIHGAPQKKQSTMDPSWDDDINMM